LYRLMQERALSWDSIGESVGNVDTGQMGPALNEEYYDGRDGRYYKVGGRRTTRIG
jgi:hypothetical protein